MSSSPLVSTKKTAEKGRTQQEVHSLVSTKQTLTDGDNKMIKDDP